MRGALGLRCAGGRSRSRSREGRAAVRESRDGIGNLEVGARARASSNTQGRTIVSSTWTCFRNRDCSVQRRRGGRRVGRRVGGGNGWLQSPLAMERERRFVPTFGCRRGTGTRSDSTTVTLEPSSRGRAGGRNMVGWCWCCRGVECLAGMRSSSAMFGAIRRPLLTPTFSFHMRDSTLFTRPAAFGARCVKARAIGARAFLGYDFHFHPNSRELHPCSVPRDARAAPSCAARVVDCTASLGTTNQHAPIGVSTTSDSAPP
jgi:hypothetical protein